MIRVLAQGQMAGQQKDSEDACPSFLDRNANAGLTCYQRCIAGLCCV